MAWEANRCVRLSCNKLDGDDYLMRPSPRHPLQGKLPEKSVANLTTAWNDGRLIAALVDAIAPGLCPEHEEMNPEKSFENAAYAMKLAEDWLGVPQVMVSLLAKRLYL